MNDLDKWDFKAEIDLRNPKRAKKELNKFLRDVNGKEE